MKPRLTLKTRFTLVAAGAVAAVALAITAVAFVAIRTDLQNQVQQEVASRADSRWAMMAARQCQVIPPTAFHGKKVLNGMWLMPASHAVAKRISAIQRPMKTVLAPCRLK